MAAVTIMVMVMVMVMIVAVVVIAGVVMVAMRVMITAAEIIGVIVLMISAIPNIAARLQQPSIFRPTGWRQSLCIIRKRGRRAGANQKADDPPDSRVAPDSYGLTHNSTTIHVSISGLDAVAHATASSKAECYSRSTGWMLSKDPE